MPIFNKLWFLDSSFAPNALKCIAHRVHSALLKIVTSILTLVTNRLSILPQIKNDRNENQGDETEKTVTPVKSELREHGIREEREGSSESRPE